MLIALGFAIGHGDSRAPGDAGGRRRAAVRGCWRSCRSCSAIRAGTPRCTSPRKSATRRATCRWRWRSAPLRSSIIYVALNALYIFALPIGELAALPDGRLMDTVAERLFGFATGNLHRALHHHQHRREHQRDGAGGAARLLRDGARRDVRARRRAASIRAFTRRPPRSSRRASGAACWCCPARWRSS